VVVVTLVADAVVLVFLVVATVQIKIMIVLVKGNNDVCCLFGKRNNRQHLTLPLPTYLYLRGVNIVTVVIDVIVSVRVVAALLLKGRTTFIFVVFFSFDSFLRSRCDETERIE